MFFAVFLFLLHFCYAPEKKMLISIATVVKGFYIGIQLDWND